MIVVVSCSSPVSSIAVLSGLGEVLYSAEKETAWNASGAALEMLEAGLKQLDVLLSEADLFVADLGPGSFIGSRVGVTLAKSLAFAVGKQTAGLSSFDLISPESTVVLPSKKGEYFLRVPGEEVIRTSVLPIGIDWVGYGPDLQIQTYPNAARAASMISKLKPIAPELLLPEYLIEPSISQPKSAGI